MVAYLDAVPICTISVREKFLKCLHLLKEAAIRSEECGSTKWIYLLLGLIVPLLHQLERVHDLSI